VAVERFTPLFYQPKNQEKGGGIGDTMGGAGGDGGERGGNGGLQVLLVALAEVIYPLDAKS
jgi:hypothetical protein